MKTKYIAFLIALSVLLRASSNAQTIFAVSADKMNVLYVGIDNPVTIAVSGIDASKISASTNNGSMEGANGKYMVRPIKCCVSTIKLFAKNKNGGMDSVGQIQFRAKHIPNPVPSVYGKRGTANIKLSEVQFLKYVIAQLDDFVFNVSFPIVSFTLSMIIDGKEVSETAAGSSLTEQQKIMLSKAKVGDRLNFENIKTRRPGGDTLDIGGVYLKVIE